MSAPIIRRVCSSCLLKRHLSCFKTIVKPVSIDVRKCGIIITRSHEWNNNLPTTYISQIHHRLLGTSSGNSNNARSVVSVSQTNPQNMTDLQAETSHVIPNDTGVMPKVNEAIQSPDLGRLFAVIHLAGKQFKVTTDDIVVVTGFFTPEVGDRIRLEKVLLAGSKDFTVVGRPILDRDVVKVEATVIEKTLSVPKVWFHYIRRKGYRKFKLVQTPQTMLVVNSIEVSPLADNKK